MGPLDGVRIVELASLGPAPYACMMLADLGADVVRVEGRDAPLATLRAWDQMVQPRFSVSLNLKDAADRDDALALIEHADVLIEGYRPGVCERLGLGPDVALARNPALVYGRMTGYGQEGVLARQPGHDINYLALSGALWTIGHAGERPAPPVNYVADFGGGALFLVVGVLAALRHAQATGEGQVIDAAMVDGATSLTTMVHAFRHAGIWRDERGVNLLDGGAHFYDTYETSDGRFIAVGAIEPAFYQCFLEGLGLDVHELGDQYDESRWAVNRERVAAIVRTRTRDDWCAHFNPDACVTPVLSPAEVASYAPHGERGLFTDAGWPAPAPRFSVTSTQRRSSREGASLLVDWGLEEDRVRGLLGRAVPS